jgi:alpha-amylase
MANTHNSRGVMFQYFEWNNPADGSLWRQLAEQAVELSNLGTTAVWMPPAYKSMDGPHGTGYAVYDLFDLGEFDQKGSVRTKYGTKDEFVGAVKAVQDAGMHAYADVVFNHRMGADAEEEIDAEPVAVDDRNRCIGPACKVKVWSKFDFAGRGGKYSAMKYDHRHFGGFGLQGPNGEQQIWRAAGRGFSGEVSREHGNFDYLMGADVDLYHPDVRADLELWGRWFLETTGVNGFRLDAVKHIPSSFYRDWFKHLREHFKDREVFGVGEYWSGDLGELQHYLAETEGVMRLFDAPLHFNLHAASKGGNNYDLRKIFDGTLVRQNPLMAVTFVDNHDSQPGQSLESWVDDWFKQHAYALILLRKDGYPCVFYGDYFGNDDPNHKLTRHRKIIDDLLQARAKYTHGDQHDYFDHPNCVGWTWTGDEAHPGGLAVLMSNGDAGRKTMKTFRPKCTYRDITGHWPEPVTTDEHGEAEFVCPAGKTSVWCMV